jgi:hypothetical protein
VGTRSGAQMGSREGRLLPGKPVASWGILRRADGILAETVAAWPSQPGSTMGEGGGVMRGMVPQPERSTVVTREPSVVSRTG